MKRVKTIKDHLRYYKTYGGFKPRKRMPVIPEQPALPEPVPFKAQPRDKAASRLKAVEERLNEMAAAKTATGKPDQGLINAAKRLRTIEARLQSIEGQPKPEPKDPEEAKRRLRDARSIRALETRIRELEARPVTSPGLDLARSRLEASKNKRAKRVKETNAPTPSLPSGPDNRGPRP